MGKVYLVGAGPGDPDLITIKGRKVLERADVVLYDALANPRLLDYAPAKAERIYVGKKRAQHEMSQEEIHALLIEKARAGANVVRLKGGDPFIFGRGGEEVEALAAAGIGFEIVPGVTTAFAAAASIKQPLTKRGVARNVAFFTSTTGRGEPDDVALPGCDTLIQYMGGQEAIDTARRLLEHGKSPDTPVVAIENVSRSDERVFRLSLAAMVNGLPTGEGPVLVMIGEALRERSDN